MGSWSKGAEDSKGSNRAAWLPYGTHDVEVLEAVGIKPRKGSKVLVKTRVKILASNVKECKTEDVFDMGINVDTDNQDNWNLQISDVRSVIASAFDVPVKEVGEPEIDMAYPDAVGDKTPKSALVGKRLRVVATNLYADTGGDFTKYACSPFRDAYFKTLAAKAA